MESFILPLVFILGLVVGSFLNVVIFRLETGDRIVNDRSKCMACGHQLSWKDMFPVLSFLSLKGKCRYCAARISWQYPLVEIATGILFVLAFEKVFYSLTDFSALGLFYFFVLAFVFSAFLVMFVYDLRFYIIPDEVVYSAIAIVLLSDVVNILMDPSLLNLDKVFSIIFPAVLAGGFFLALVIMTRGRGMGGGDVKLGFLMGLVLGFPDIVLALFLAFILGATVGVLLILSGKKKMKSMLPFGPFLIFGFFVAYFYGSAIVDWYWRVVLG